MSRVIDWLGDAFFGVLNFFLNISAARGDDPETAQFKRLKRAVIASSFIFALILVIDLVIASMLASVYDSSTGQVLRQISDQFAYGFLGVAAAALLYAAYTWYALWKFERRYR